ncbi:ATP-binding protein (plasmid) [Clavibacter michiganensis subsp. michiganensis]|uniref:ATP-binding protein n=1 Tax=Clavibacter michiganensis TaxID=28447 RepID=UPI002362D8FA|nr:ATP-binding protein [Clavibacter michiganensis]WDD26985.1 ATP-binding protein [Clavibacter michiganensis subsp. michiganensis]WDD30096.1 ATP-binding protein [Clavibacter michiganensis subsp. michiganensis]
MGGTMTRRLTRTPMGFLGHGGGMWSRVPQAPMWFSTSVQGCGIYPFGVGTGRPTDGAPLGRDVDTHTAVCTDHEALYRANVISSPTGILFGINGVGKSTTAQTILLGQMGRGLTPAVFDPIKGEHVPMIRAVGGQVFSIGPGAGRDKLNIVSPGPLGAAAARIGGHVGEELAQLARDKAVALVQLNARVSRGHPLDDIEDTALEAIVDSLRERTSRPVTRDLVTVFDAVSDRMLHVTGQRDADSFRARFARLGETLRSMISGEMGQMLSGVDSVEFDPGNPGGLCFDTSSIDPSNTRLLSAAMLSTWSLGMDAIDAHWELAQHEQRLVEEAALAGEMYVPKVTWSGYTSLMDECWYPLRACEGIVDRYDALIRTNRSKGVAELKVTHSPKDLISLPNPADREKARGFVERSGLVYLMALTRDDLESLSGIRRLTTKEINRVASFNAAPSWKMPPRRKGEKGAPPGAGRVMLKLPERAGITVQMFQTDVQQQLHVTDERYRQ